MQLTLDQIIQATQATTLHVDCNGASLSVTGICADSRMVRPGDMFVCISKGNRDGHQFAASAIEAGATALLAERDPFEGNAENSTVPTLIVQDTVRAMGLLARFWRNAFFGTVIGVTGSAGKTTVKDMLAHVLSLAGETAKNPLNLNSQEGLPLSILATSGKEQYWVMEAGINHEGDMDDLGPILAPDMALILNVGQAHTQGLGIKGVARQKATLLKYLAPKGTALISADYPDLVKESRVIYPAPTYFSVTGKQLGYRASYLGLNSEDHGMYRLWLDGASLDVTSPLGGAYGAENVMAVAAAAHLLGLEPELIAQGLATVALPPQRFNRRDVAGWTILDDTYNANPLSCARMLEATAEMARDRSLVCVMGEMRELGDPEEAHLELGKQIAGSGAKALFWYGGYGDMVRAGLEESGFSGSFFPIQDGQSFMEAFLPWDKGRSFRGDNIILFKGSRGNRLERMVEAFLQAKKPQEHTGGGHAV